MKRPSPWLLVALLVALLLAVPGVPAQSVAPGTPSSDVQCAVDSNGNGTIDEDELQPCDGSAVNGSTAYLCPIDAQACTNPSPGVYTCPLGASYACAANTSGAMQCSPHACASLSGADVVITPAGNDPIPTSTAPVTGAGCQGTITLFSGHKSTCRPAGVQNFWTGCCRASASTTDTMDGSQLDAVTGFLGAAPLLEPSCPASDVQTEALNLSGMCVAVGSYCGENVPLVGCVQQVNAYCCFNSVLARLIQQQGRPQLPAMGGWGTAESPNCGGFTPAQFQSLDFSKIDLSSYYAQLQVTSQQQIQQSVNLNGY